MLTVNVPETRAAASVYARERLEGEDILREPASKNLKATIIVPICGEPIRRVMELFQSIAKQEQIEAGEIEVIAVINNGPDDGTVAFHADRNKNFLLMEIPFWKNRADFGAEHKFPADVIKQAREIGRQIPIYAIDKCSEGQAFKMRSIGLARDRGLAEATARFLGLERDGLAIFLDADVVLEDALFIRKAIDVFDKRREVIAASGGLDYRFDPDAQQPRERKREIQQIEHYLQLRRWQAMNQFLQQGKADLLPPDAFIGACMFARVFEAAAWGGFRAVQHTEDAFFGQDGRAFASKQGMHVVSLKDLLRASTALRYQHWMGREFDPTDDEVRLPFTVEEYQDLEQKLAASEQGKNFLKRLEDPAVLLYQDLHLV